MGLNIPFIVCCVLLFGLALPLLLIYFVKSPQPQQHLIIFGVSYYKLIFIFLLSSAAMVYVSVFFFGSNPIAIFSIFILSLFCSFPIIVGLKNNLTLEQAISEIPFFSGWPFFLKPGYILIEFLIPAGILIYLFLQIKRIFSKKPHGYVFLCAALYLSIAVFLGFASLNQAGQLHIWTALAGQRGFPAPDKSGFSSVRTPIQDFPSAKANSQYANKLTRFQIPPSDDTEQEPSISKPFQPVPIKEPAADKLAAVAPRPKEQTLSEKVYRIL